MSGGCLCGAVRYTVNKPISEIAVCHCQMCRKHSGGLVLAADLEKGDVTWSGTDNIGVFASSEWAERGFCKTCGSSLFWRMSDGEMLSLSAGTLDSFEGITLTTEIYVDHKPASFSFAGDTNKLTQAEVEAMFASPGEGEPT
ncbi:MAG: GFA family protein [Sedimentitalea sp.]